MPTQRPTAVAESAPPVRLQSGAASRGTRAEEGVTQFSLSMRKELRKQLARLASDADMTMRAFVLNALKEMGLAVHEDDLIECARNAADG